MIKKRYLLTPGPTPIPPEVNLLMAEPILHHRSPQFQEILRKVLEGIKRVLKTKNDVLIFASSGTGAMEAVVANLVSPQEKVIVIRGGKFGERWAEICATYGAKVIPIDVPWGKAVEAEEVERSLDTTDSVKAVFATLCETSTGTVTDIRRLAETTRKKEVLLVVDAISGLCADNLETDNWGVDVVVAGSQKGLMLPPGLAFVSMSKKAWALSKHTSSSYYFDFKKYQHLLSKPDTPFTPPISLIIGLERALSLIEEEGLENVLSRHRYLANAVREGIKAMGLELFSTCPSNALTAVISPSGISSTELIRIMRDKFGIWIANGQGKMKGKIFRIAHLGYMDRFDVIVALSALEMSLREMGYKIELGKGVGTAERILGGENAQG
ncbi:MAG: aminotransferase [Candidatus Omnitrophota bacterium]|nr:MAG: aminotransferase [Candidatus Omnitrophota bacterium]